MMISRIRLAASAVVAVAATALGGVVPAVGHAAPAGVAANVPCPAGITWHPFFKWFDITYYRGYHYTVTSAASAFFVSDARQVNNSTTTPIKVTLTSQQSRTFSVSTTVGFASELHTKLKLNVSTTIEFSRTTQIGVNVEATVAPLSTLLGEYGVQGYNVGYNADTYATNSRLLRTNSCVHEAAQTGLSTVAPTFVEGWRLTTL